MPGIIKDVISDATGETASYHVIGPVQYNPSPLTDPQTVSMQIVTFVSQDMMKAGKNSVWSKSTPTYVIGPGEGQFPYDPTKTDILTQLYAFLLTQPEWADAKLAE